MNPTQGIQLLNRREINDAQWNACIDASPNGMPYAYSWYLDIVAKGKWSGYVIGDYDAVFPMPERTRFLRKEIYQPLFTQQLGLFATSASTTLLPDVLNRLKEENKRFRLHLNTGNVLRGNTFPHSLRTTYHIDLSHAYEVLNKSYSSQTIRNLKSATKNNLHIADRKDIPVLIEMRKKWLRKMLDENKQGEKDTRRLQKALEAIIQHDKGFLRTVCDASGNMLAAACIVASNAKIIYLSAVSTDAGKEQHAMTFLIDSLLRQFAGTRQTFDFEGSMLEGLARYYSGFGAVPVPYALIKQGM